MTDQKSSIHEEIRKILEECGEGDYIFRGEEKNFEKVSSNLYRHYRLEEKDAGGSQGDSFDALNIEEDTVKSAKRHFSHTTSNIEVLTELQHYGGKTTLIDFTRNIYIALFFACEESPGVEDAEDGDGRIICLNLKDIEPREEIDYEQKELYNEDGWIVPVGKNPRVVFQSSVFVHAPKGYITSEYRTIAVERKLKNKFLVYMDQYFDINKKSIYNDIHGFIKHYRPGDYEPFSPERMQLDRD